MLFAKFLLLALCATISSAHGKLFVTVTILPCHTLLSYSHKLSVRILQPPFLRVLPNKTLPCHSISLFDATGSVPRKLGQSLSYGTNTAAM
jgi:hypothetical protein